MRASDAVGTDVPVREVAQPATNETSTAQRWLPLIGVLVLGVLPYLNALDAFWVGDDYNYVVPKTFDTVLNFFNPIGRAQFRPFNWLSWAGDYALFGPDPPGWHLTQLAMHLANVLLIVLLLQELARGWWPGEPAARRWVPLLAGALYAIHPAGPEAVTWIGGRADVPFALGLFLAAWALARWRTGGRRHPGFYLLAVFGTWLSIQGKEAGLITPLALLLVDWAIPEGGGPIPPAPFPAREGGDGPIPPAPFPAREGGDGSDLRSIERQESGGEVGRMLIAALANGAGRVAVYALVLVVPLILLNQGGAGQTGLGVFWARMTMPLLLLIGLHWPRRVAASPPRVMGRLAALARDQAPFFAIAAAYAVLRLGLYVAGLGRLMYGTETHLRFAPTTLLDSATSYLLIGVGAWEAPQEVALWPTLIKVGIALAALLVAAGAVRWLRGPALFAVLWVPATLLVTFDTAADRWFYVPALGVCLLAALLIYRAGTARPAVRWALAAGLVLIWGGETAGVNARWVESGEVARGLIAQIRTLQPNPPRPATFYMANPPATYHGILLFNSGFSEAPSFAYQDYTTVKGYELQEHAGQVQAALSDPAQVGPHPFFLRYENGRLVAYPSLAALVAAQAKAGGP